MIATEKTLTELYSSASKGKFDKAKNDILKSVAIQKDNINWTQTVDKYFNADPYKLDLALSQCNEYMN